MPAGYSKTPLAKKLGIKQGDSVVTINEPADFRSLLVGLPQDTSFTDDLSTKPEIVIGFFTSQADLDSHLAQMGNAVFPDRTIWIAWPKRTSGVETDLTGDVVRATVLETHLVDVKVCAISDIWSGLKVVWRKERRG